MSRGAALGYVVDVLLYHDGLPLVPALNVHLEFFDAGEVRGVILRRLCGGGPYDYRVTQSPLYILGIRDYWS